MKKLSVVLALVMLCSVVTFSAAAQDEAVASISSVTATAGGTCTMTVTLKNSPAIVGANLQLSYDSNVMSFVSARSLNNKFTFQFSTEQKANPVKIVMANMELAESSGEIQVAEITFKMAANVADGRYTVKLSVEEAYNKNIDAVSYKTENGVVAVGNPPAMEIKMTLNQKQYIQNGETVAMDVAPKVVNDRTMLPARAIAEALGAIVGWDGDLSAATFTNDTTVIKIIIGSDVAIVNGEEVKLEAAAFIEDGRTFLPLRFICENLGATVDWDAATSTATITK